NMPPPVRPVHKIEGQSQKQSDCVVGWDISWHQYLAQKRPQRYGWARKVGGFCRKVLAPPVRLWELRESVRKPVSKMVCQSRLQIQRRKGCGHLFPRWLAGGYASNVLCNPEPHHPCGSS